MTNPVRSLRLEKRSSRTLDVLSGSEGEIFYDSNLKTLRVYTSNAGEKIILANRNWVTENTFDGNYNNLTNKPTALSAFTNDVGYVTQSSLGDLSLTSLGFAAGATVNEFSTDGTLSDNSNQAVPTEAAVKTYIDTAVSGLAPTALEDLTDVTYTGSPQVNDVLTWNGTDWANSPAVVDLSSYYTSAETDTAISTAISNFQTTIIDAAPAALDTLNELAAALGDDANFATTVTTALGTKAPLDSPEFTNAITVKDGALNTGILDANGSTLIISSRGSLYIKPNQATEAWYQLSDTEFYSRLPLRTHGFVKQRGTLTNASTGIYNIYLSTGLEFPSSSSFLSAGFTLDIIGMPFTVTDTDRTLVFEVAIDQDSTPRMLGAVTVAGVATTLKWENGSAATPVANREQIVRLQIRANGAAWIVLADAKSYA